MNHNPHNLQIGDIVTIDLGFNSQGDVKIVDFSPQKIFSTVSDPNYTDPNDTWDVMTYRLTPKQKKDESQEAESSFGA